MPYQEFLDKFGVVDATAFNSKVSDNQAECDGSPDMAPQSWVILSWLISLLVEVFENSLVREEALLCQSIHAFLCLNIDPFISLQI